MKQLHPLTGLRGVAAFTVLIGHGISFSCVYGGINLIHGFATRMAYFGMALFFVLSGFVIYYNYSHSFKTKKYLSATYEFAVARFARLYPLYALAMICYLDKLPSEVFHNREVAELAYLTLTQSWFDLQSVMFPPAWSISTECFFYLIFILILPVFEKITRPMLAMLLFIPITFIFIPNLINFEMSLYTGESTWITYFSPYTRIFDFIAGMLAGKYYISVKNERDINKIEIICSIIAMIWVVGVIAFDPLRNTHYALLLPNFIYTPALVPLLIICCKYDMYLSRFLSSRLLIFLGEISYSTYLLSFMIMGAFGSVYISKEPSITAYINSAIKISGISLFSIIIAYGSYSLIEKPSRRYLRKLFLRKTKSVVGSLHLDSGN